MITVSPASQDRQELYSDPHSTHSDFPTPPVLGSSLITPIGHWKFSHETEKEKNLIEFQNWVHAKHLH
jgi:hypothetical protein